MQLALIFFNAFEQVINTNKTVNSIQIHSTKQDNNKNVTCLFKCPFYGIYTTSKLVKPNKQRSSEPKNYIQQVTEKNLTFS